MSKKTNDLDVNQAFEDLLFAEENAQSTGYAEGYEAGKSQLVKGYHLGYHRASSLAAQLGYYCGTLDQYLSADKSNTQKAVQIAKEVRQNIYDFPRHNDEATDILKAVEGIKFKYAKFCSLAKISSSYPEADKLEF